MPSDSHVPPAAAGSLFDFRTMLDAMETARRSWSGMTIPSSMTPTVDPEELDKRISDLKTVEQWLVLNLNLLRGSIQALELQRATLSSLHSFGEAARAAAQAAAQPSPEPTDARHAEPSARRESETAPGASAPAWPTGIDPAAWWQTLQSQFQQVAESAISGMAPSVAAAPATRAAAGSSGTDSASDDGAARRGQAKRRAPRAPSGAPDTAPRPARKRT